MTNSSLFVLVSELPLLRPLFLNVFLFLLWMGANYNIGRMGRGKNGNIKPEEVSLGLEVSDGHFNRHFAGGWCLHSLKVVGVEYPILYKCRLQQS